MMEWKLLDSKSASPPEIVGLGRVCLNRFSSGRHGTRVALHYCSCRRGIEFKASYPRTSTSRPSNDSVGRKKFLLSNEESKVSGINEVPSSSLYAEKYGILDAYEDEYEGVFINPEQLPSNASAFVYILRASLSHWKLKGKKGVWLKLPREQSELVPIAVKEGFKYHHAEPEYVMLTFWMSEGPCMLPANASHQVGVGGFVINDKNEVLVVKEKHCSSAYAGVWKLPTGFVLESEEIFTGAVREVKEETGIDTEFVEVIAFRHALHVAFGKSDLFFICVLKPLSTRIAIDELEIQAAKWMYLAEFMEQPFIQGDIMFRKIINICIARLGKQYCGLSAHHIISKFDGKMSSLYYSVVEDQHLNCEKR